MGAWRCMNTKISTQPLTGHDRPADAPPGDVTDEGARAVRRILSRAGTAVSDESPRQPWAEHDGDQFDLADRQALKRVGGLSTELEDVTEVEYRQLRLERVVLAGLWG